MTRTRTVLEWVQIAFGLLVFSFGVHLTIFANIGLAPWDCLGMGIAAHTPLNYGLAMTSTSVLILLLDLVLGERIGYGTIIDALLTGNFVQLFNDASPLKPCESLLPGVAMMLVGFAIMAVGMWIYMRAGQCCGPRDALLVGLGKRLPRVPIGVVQIALWSMVTVAGWLLGGPVGVGTLLSAFAAGAIMQVVYQLLHFEPRDVQHRDVIEVNRLLVSRGGQSPL
ncbi:MAG: hypothetical protein IKG18_07825 [Atopobiaceae bacterium]|nr:hypothetical protein [Atopobiaceae bacterium]